MKHMKRILSFALVLVMVLSCMPIQALAAENAETAYVAINQTTGKGYDNLLVAMGECRKGETVALQKDASEMQVLVPADGILDLNGCTLEAEYMSCFGDLIDSSDDNSGLLKVNEDYFLIRGDNKQLPIKDGTGFRFVEITKINTKMLTPTKFVFQPLFEAAALDLIAKGGDVTGLTVQVLVGWKQNDGYRTQEFVYNDDLLTQFLGSYNAATGKYGKMFTLTLNNVDGIEELSFAAVLASSTKVTISSATEKEEVTGNVTTDANNQVVNQVILDNGSASAVVSTGTQLVGGTNKVTLSATEMEKTTSNVTLGANEKMQSMNVHVEGVSVENTVPILVTLDKLAPEFLNQGNLKLYHVENGETVEMTRVYALSEVDAHNEFYYDIATGTVTMALATFSEIAVVSDTTKAWEGKFDYTWYTNAVAPVDGEAVTEYVIANADQLAALSAIVGGMNGQTQDSFAGKTVKLIADINLGDKESENNPDIIFYPIGYYNSEGTYERTNTAITSGLKNFEGTFDGNGHTVSNFYQNTWEMKGDHDWYTPEEQYYRDGMGLFGRVYGGTIKNLTVKNFSSDGEITTTGTVAAYADFGATFENISIFNCNPRVYNIGNGGIVGCVGWYAKEAGLKTTFSNITVDNSNKISALWGSYDVACGGIVGQYYPTSGQSSANYPVNAGIHFENCHVAAQMDVYNDVCANYQYYAYRYTGMLIGSIRENVTENGHSYPKMDGITASGCTVHFGTWNDYYYCELVDNTTASYTHDYQMSRLTEIKAIDGTTITYLDGTTGTVPASGRANYVIVDYTKGHGTENATCYHFLNGEVWTHDMGGIQTGIDENGDGQDDLKEDKQHIYLEFNNLVTGYGWGVTTKAVGDLDGVKILDRVEADSVVKFNGTANGQEFITGTTVTIGQLFQAKDQNEVKIDPTKVQVFVSAVGDNSDVSATYTANTTDWTQGTLTFSGAGAATITITDYYFCTPTTITVTVEDNQPVEKFDKKFDKDFLYRVGNADKSPVGIGYLFKAKDGAAIGDVSITIENVAGSAAGSYTADATWKNGKIQFSGTGVVKVTITDNDYCSPTELILEVVDAENITGVGGTISGNKVLLQDTSSGGFVVDNGNAFYGNGFKVTCSGKGSNLNHNGMTSGYVTVASGGILDNVQIICDVYPESYVYTTEVKVSSNIDTALTTSEKTYYMYQLSAIAVSGDGSVVANCYAYGGRNNIYVGGGDVTIENTVTECGTLANIQIKGSSADIVTLKDVTTIQYQTTSKYNSSKVMLGFGVVVGDNESESNANIILQGDLKQYNWVTEADKDVSNTYAKSAIDGALGMSQYQHTINGKTTINMGIAYLNTKTTSFPAANDQRSNKSEIPYEMNAISISGKTGYVYSVINSGIDESDRYNAEADGVIPYVPNAQRDIAPKPEFSLGDQAVEGEDRYLTGDINGITARYEVGQDAFTLDITKLMNAYKYGFACEVTAICTDPEGNTLSGNITLDKTGTYTLKFTIVDTTFYSLTGEVIEKRLEYTHSVKITLTVAEPSVPDAILTVKPGSYTGTYTDASGGDKKLSFNPLAAITVVDAGENVVLTANVETYEIIYNAKGSDQQPTAYGGTPQIIVTYTDGRVLTMVIQRVSGNSPGSPRTISYDPASGTIKSDSRVAKKSCTGFVWKVISYSFAGKNGKTVTGGPVEFSIAADTSGSTPCVTADTLVTLADGTQKRIDEVSAQDMFLIWDFVKGEYTFAPASILMNHGFAQNTVIELTFSDGTTVKAVNYHGFFHESSNKFVILDENNAEDYIGESFVKQDGNGYTSVTLESVNISEEYIEAWSILTVGHYNAVLNGMFTLTPAEVSGSDEYLMPFAIGEDMKYDAEAMQADIEKYGLYTYEDFADYMTYEQFTALNLSIWKVSVGKGYITFEDIVFLAKLHLS